MKKKVQHFVCFALIAIVMTNTITAEAADTVNATAGSSVSFILSKNQDKIEGNGTSTGNTNQSNGQAGVNNTSIIRAENLLASTIPSMGLRQEQTVGGDNSFAELNHGTLNTDFLKEFADLMLDYYRQGQNYAYNYDKDRTAPYNGYADIEGGQEQAERVLMNFAGIDLLPDYSGQLNLNFGMTDGTYANIIVETAKSYLGKGITYAQGRTSDGRKHCTVYCGHCIVVQMNDIDTYRLSDCSSFTQKVFSMCGITIPRTSSLQSQHGELITDISSLKAGDLVFFAERGSANVSHVGIYEGNDRFIHCSTSGIREDTFSTYITRYQRFVCGRRQQGVNSLDINNNLLDKTREDLTGEPSLKDYTNMTNRYENIKQYVDFTGLNTEVGAYYIAEYKIEDIESKHITSTMYDNDYLINVYSIGDGDEELLASQNVKRRNLTIMFSNPGLYRVAALQKGQQTSKTIYKCVKCEYLVLEDTGQVIWSRRSERKYSRNEASADIRAESLNATVNVTEGDINSKWIDSPGNIIEIQNTERVD